MLHITLTGAYAGVPICGINKRAAAERGDEFGHYHWNCLTWDNLCPDCRAEILASEAEDEGFPNTIGEATL